MLRRYLFASFSQLFFPLFVVLFFISSIVLLISIVSKTYIVKLNLLDIATIFSYSLPNSIFFIISISFFVSLVLCISRLAYEYELMVFFALGIRPTEILKIFLPITLLASLVLLVFSCVVVPLTFSASKNFIAQKRADIDVNLRAGELGQKLGDWFVHVDKAKNRQYENVVLYSKDHQGEEMFIVAKHGTIKNQDGIFSLMLKDGDVYLTKNNKVKKIIYKDMSIRQLIGEVQLSSQDLFTYWTGAFAKEKSLERWRKQRKLSQAIMVSLFPLSSIFLVLAFGIANPRFSSNKSYTCVFIASAIYFALVYVLSSEAPIVGFVALPLVWFIISYLIYAKTIKRCY